MNQFLYLFIVNQWWAGVYSLKFGSSISNK